LYDRFIDEIEYQIIYFYCELEKELDEIEKHMDISIDTIKKILLKNNIKIRENIISNLKKNSNEIILKYEEKESDQYKLNIKKSSKIITLYVFKGMSISEINSKYSFSKLEIIKLLLHNRIKFRNEDLVENDLILKSIGIEKKRKREVNRRNGINAKHRDTLKEIKDDQIQEIIKLYVEKKYSVKSIAKVQNLSKLMIEHILSYNGIKLRSIDEWLDLYNHDTIEKIAKLYTIDKISVTDISRRSDFTVTAIKKLLERENIPLRSYRLRKQFSEERKQQFIRLYRDERWTLAAIGRFYGIAPKYISQILKNNNIEVKLSSRTAKVKADDVESIHKRKILELRKQGHTARSIAAELDLTYKLVVAVISKNLDRI